ncbi:hypothetical protein I4U23_031390 [Adineta vaga]|nr:hypothetical protein I4U23_031390 [Adineta vaga]
MSSCFSHMALVFLSLLIFLSIYSIVTVYGDELETNLLDFSPLSNGDDNFINNPRSLWENTYPPDAVSYADISHTIVDNRLEGNLYEVRFSPDIMSYCNDRILIGESTSFKLINNIQISFFDQYDNIIVDNFGNPIQYNSYPHDLGHLINILYNGFEFSYAKCLLNLQSNSNFDLHNLFFHFSPSSIGKSIDFTKGIISGSTVFTVGSISNVYTVSIKCPLDATCMWMLDKNVIFSGSNTNITLTFNDNDVGNRTLSYVKFIRNKRTILASLLLNLLPIIDLNGDKRPDIVVAGESPYRIYVFLNKKDGTFPSFAAYHLQKEPRSLVVMDLNNDGAPDIIIATDSNVNKGHGNVDIFLNLGNGTFLSPTNYHLEISSTLLAVKDLNDDKAPDIVIASDYDKHVNILLNIGNGTFISSTNYSLNNKPTSLVLMDLNNDTAPDIIIAFEYDNRIGILLNLEIKDLNNDGAPDIIIATDSNVNKDHGNVDILLNLGNGTFLSPTNYSVNYTESLVVIDLNGDKAPDIVLASDDGYDEGYPIEILLNLGNGTFLHHAIYSTVFFPTSLAVADVNGDNLLDIIVGNDDETVIEVFFNSGISSLNIFGYENVGLWKQIRPILAGQTDRPHVIMTDLDYLNDQYGALHQHFFIILGKYRSWSNLTTDQVLIGYT